MMINNVAMVSDNKQTPGGQYIEQNNLEVSLLSFE